MNAFLAWWKRHIEGKPVRDPIDTAQLIEDVRNERENAIIASLSITPKDDLIED